MLNREEYNATFKHDLSQEEFEKLKPIILGSDNIKTIESLSFVDPETHELTEFVQVVRCKDCVHRDPEDKRCDCGGHEWFVGKIVPVADDFYCADGERKEKEECSD